MKFCNFEETENEEFENLLFKVSPVVQQDECEKRNKHEKLFLFLNFTEQLTYFSITVPIHYTIGSTNFALQTPGGLLIYQ